MPHRKKLGSKISLIYSGFQSHGVPSIKLTLGADIGDHITVKSTVKSPHHVVHALGHTVAAAVSERTFVTETVQI